MNLSDDGKEFPFFDRSPKIDPSVFLAPGAHVYADVTVGRDSSVWFNSVVRGDVNFIRIGERTNIQDFCLVHVSHGTYPAIIGDDVTVGHSAVIHACTMGDRVLIGMGTVILDGAEIGDDVLIGAGSLITQRAKIPSGCKAFGRPAKVVAELTDEERKAIRVSAQRYVSLSRLYAAQAARRPS